GRVRDTNGDRAAVRSRCPAVVSTALSGVIDAVPLVVQVLNATVLAESNRRRRHKLRRAAHVSSPAAHACAPDCLVLGRALLDRTVLRNFLDAKERTWINARQRTTSRSTFGGRRRSRLRCGGWLTFSLRRTALALRAGRQPERRRCDKQQRRTCETHRVCS